jgi:hypothetical protein
MIKALHSATRSHLAFLILKVAIFYSSSVLSSLQESSLGLAQPGRAGTKQGKAFSIRILRIARIKNQWLESGRFGKSGYH